MLAGGETVFEMKDTVAMGGVKAAEDGEHSEADIPEPNVVEKTLDLGKQSRTGIVSRVWQGLFS